MHSVPRDSTAAESRIVLWLFLTCSGIWGSTWLAITFQLGPVAPEASVTYRFALAAAILGAWCIATGRSLRFAPRVHGWLAAQGVMMFGVNYVLVYKAEQHIASGLVAVIFSTIVFMSLVGTRLCFGEPITARAVAGASLGVGGVGLLFVPEFMTFGRGGDAMRGTAYALIATIVCTGGNLVSMRIQRANVPILESTAWGMAYGALLAAAWATVEGVHWTFAWTPAYVGSLLYLAVFGSVIAFGTYLTLLKHVGAGPSSYVSVATPVLAMLLSTLLEGYRWTWVGGVGVALAVTGNLLVLRRASGRPTARTARVDVVSPRRPS